LPCNTKFTLLCIFPASPTFLLDFHLASKAAGICLPPPEAATKKDVFPGKEKDKHRAGNRKELQSRIILEVQFGMQVKIQDFPIVGKREAPEHLDAS
jgi:hypothetical protein